MKNRLFPTFSDFFRFFPENVSLGQRFHWFPRFSRKTDFSDFPIFSDLFRFNLIFSDLMTRLLYRIRFSRNRILYRILISLIFSDFFRFFLIYSDLFWFFLIFSKIPKLQILIVFQNPKTNIFPFHQNLKTKAGSSWIPWFFLIGSDFFRFFLIGSDFSWFFRFSTDFTDFPRGNQ